MRNRRNEFGQFFTNHIIAEFMVKSAITVNTRKMLDPAVGLGILTKTAYSYNKNLQIEACEIDPKIIEDFQMKNRYPYKLHRNDYLTTPFYGLFDAIICNPPYNKFQYVPNRNKLIADFKKLYNISMSGYSNLYVYFLVKSLNELDHNGRCCYIVPYEFMSTGYGIAVKKYLLNSGMLRYIYKFSNTLKLFDEAVTTSCIILLENNRVCTKVNFVTINDIQELKTGIFKNTIEYDYSDLDPREKWLRYFDFSFDLKKYNNIVRMSVFGKVSRGIATGANNFFVMNKTMIKKHKLSVSVCLPCLTKASDVTDVVFTDSSFQRLAKADKKVYIFDGTKAAEESDFLYIKYGESLGANKTYLTSHKSIWYSIEAKKVAPILVCVFNRNKIKIVRNEAGIKNLTTFHGLYLINDDDEFSNIMFCYLLTPIAQELLYFSRREYGDGLTKFEPNDLTNAYVVNLRIINEDDKRKILEIYKKIKETNTPIMIERLDAIFRKYTKLPYVAMAQNDSSKPGQLT